MLVPCLWSIPAHCLLLGVWRPGLSPPFWRGAALPLVQVPARRPLRILPHSPPLSRTLPLELWRACCLCLSGSRCPHAVPRLLVGMGQAAGLQPALAQAPYPSLRASPRAPPPGGVTVLPRCRLSAGTLAPARTPPSPPVAPHQHPPLRWLRHGAASLSLLLAVPGR